MEADDQGRLKKNNGYILYGLFPFAQY